MKKLSLIVIITTLTMFMSAAVASDSHNGWQWDYNPFRHFHGTYEMVASGSCSHSMEGWIGGNGKENLEATPPLKPKDPSKLYVGTTVTHGTWFFYKDGSGEFTFTNYATILPGGSYPTTDPYIKTQTPPTSTPFTFVVDSSGDITVTAGSIQIIGTISMDKNTMILSSGNQVQDFTGAGLGWAVCNSARTLIKVGD